MRRYCQHLLQKLSNNGGVDAAEEQMKARQYKITKKGSIRHPFIVAYRPFTIVSASSAESA